MNRHSAAVCVHHQMPYIIELKYSKSDATPAEIAAKAEEGIAKFWRYAVDPNKTFCAPKP